MGQARGGAGGLINIAEERNGYSPTAAGRRVRRIGETMLQIFDEAQATGATPLTAALEIARKRLSAAQGQTVV